MAEGPATPDRSELVRRWFEAWIHRDQDAGFIFMPSFGGDTIRFRASAPLD